MLTSPITFFFRNVTFVQIDKAPSPRYIAGEHNAAVSGGRSVDVASHAATSLNVG